MPPTVEPAGPNEALPGPAGVAQPRHLTAAEELQIALETINAFTGWVHNADTKIGILAGVQVTLAVMVASQAEAAIEAANVFGVAAWAVLLVFVACFAASAGYLGRALWPRLAVRGRPNRFAFPSLAACPPEELGQADPARLVAEAWEQAHTLSLIALAKFRYFGRALSWTGAALCCVLAWLATTSLTG
ncbi:Pycsar system effector family protein [Carbonactinospora thermoautotrophica]|uniref:Pycsar system effector family protein n=1 Tax=Carbonactinospora thermoautotrophica TaxID=1469144 RepID=UPI0008363946|nr:Pycsar system effector family protein [Carbonactinospora thermoautotrophica]